MSDEETRDGFAILTSWSVGRNDDVGYHVWHHNDGREICEKTAFPPYYGKGGVLYCAMLSKPQPETRTAFIVGYLMPDDAKRMKKKFGGAIVDANYSDHDEKNLVFESWEKALECETFLHENKLNQQDGFINE